MNRRVYYRDSILTGGSSLLRDTCYGLREYMTRPKIGLALSGGSGRAIAHAAVFDVLDEHGIQIDYVAACSSGTIIAAAYACGTLSKFKRDSALFTKRELLSWFKNSDEGSGLFSLEKLDERLKEYTHGLNMEDVKPQLAFVSVDLET